MSTDSVPSLPPDARAEWEELARVTADAITAEAEYDATTTVVNALRALNARKRFTELATPERIARLVAAAQRGAEAEQESDAEMEDHVAALAELQDAQTALVLLANQLEAHSVPFVPEAEAATAKARDDVARDRELLARGMEAAAQVFAAAKESRHAAD